MTYVYLHSYIYIYVDADADLLRRCSVLKLRPLLAYLEVKRHRSCETSPDRLIHYAAGHSTAVRLICRCISTSPI